MHGAHWRGGWASSPRSKTYVAAEAMHLVGPRRRSKATDVEGSSAVTIHPMRPQACDVMATADNASIAALVPAPARNAMESEVGTF